jgi:predicted ATP-grasp superfamily ATP-dependent carboligase
MRKKNLFIFEYVSGGGFNQMQIPSSLFCEGYGMLRSIILDFKKLNFKISTLLDHRIIFLASYLKADSIKETRVEDNYIELFNVEVKKCDYCFIIAPESSNILYELTKIVRDNNKKILSIDLDGIELGSSKFTCYEYFKASSVNTPQSFIIPIKKDTLDLDFIIRKYNQLNCPIIVKPDDGVGAESIFYFNSENQIHNFFTSQSNLIDSERNYILQEFIEGEDLSISLIAHKDLLEKFDKNHQILAINSQYININNEKAKSEYFGGYTPVNNLNIHISNILEKLDLTKFNGYFGIDFIRKADNSIFFIELNPRLTTSYIGVRKILSYNPAEVITNSKFKLLESEKSPININSIFTRLELKYGGTENSEEIKKKKIPILIEKIPELITPPISFSTLNNEYPRQYSCFVATKEKSLDASINRLTKIMKTFEDFNFKKLN